MKKNFVYAILSAIALSGAAGFAGCSSSDEIIDNPNYNPETNMVKTQFTISFPDNVAKTRQTAGTVQKDENIEDFRGMDNIVLYPFAATGDAGGTPIGGTSTKLSEALTLTSMIKPTVETINNSIPAYTAANTGLTSGSNSVLFDDVNIPIGTGSFLFYGKAIDNTTNTDYFYNGKLNMSGTEPADIVFDLQKIYLTDAGEEPTASAVGDALATYLSTIAQATGWAGCENTALAKLYTDFTSMKAGSSLTVQAAVQDLYHTIYKNTDAVSVAIKNAILSWNTTSSDYDFTYAQDDKTNPTGTLTFKPAIGNSATTYFPGDVNLPDGAAMLTYDSSNKTFAQTRTGAVNTGKSAKFADYVYPASLYYYSNSAIRTSTSKQAEKYGATNTTTSATYTWNEILANYDGTSIIPATRSVAILDPIQYAVGRLDMTIKTEANILYDKKGEAYDATAGFEVTGVLIGGQKQVKYNFTTNTDATEFTIYDNITKSQKSTTSTPSEPLLATTTASATNYTLALETYKDKEVYVAVELVNKGADFQGADGVVPAGCKFYLVAKLTPNAGTGYNAETMNQVFRQDYKTVANFTIPEGLPNTNASFDPDTATGLAKAYNTIPDLRTPQMELGLSVNLKWEQGLTYNISIGTE